MNNNRELTFGVPYGQNSQSANSLEICSKIHHIFIIFIYISIYLFSSIDQGILPCSIPAILTHYQSSNTLSIYSLFLCCYYIGKLISILFLHYFKSHINKKLCIIFSLLFNSLSLYVFITFDNFLYALLSRFISGFTQIFFVNFLPRYVDEFGNKQIRSIVIITIQIAVPIGSIIGSFISIIYQWNFACMVDIYAMISIAMFSIIMLKNRNIISNDSLLGNSRHTSLVKINENTNSISLFSFILSHYYFFFLLTSRTIIVVISSSINSYAIFHISNMFAISNKYKVILFISICLSLTVGAILGGMISSNVSQLSTSKISSLIILIYSIANILSLFVEKDIIKNNFIYMSIVFVTFIISNAVVLPIITTSMKILIPREMRQSFTMLITVSTMVIGNIGGSFIYILIDGNIDILFKMSFGVTIGLVLVLMSIVFQNEENKEEKKSITSNKVRKKDSTLFTTSIAGIYGDNDMDFDDEDDKYSVLVDAKHFESFGSSNSSELLEIMKDKVDNNNNNFSHADSEYKDISI